MAGGLLTTGEHLPTHYLRNWGQRSKPPPQNPQTQFSAADVASGNVVASHQSIFSQLLLKRFDLQLGLAPVRRTFRQQPVDSPAQVTHQDVEFTGLDPDLGLLLPGICSMTRRMS